MIIIQIRNTEYGYRYHTVVLRCMAYGEPYSTVQIIPYGELGIIPYGSATILHPHHTYRSTSGTTVTYVFTYYCMLYVHCIPYTMHDSYMYMKYVEIKVEVEVRRSSCSGLATYSAILILVLDYAHYSTFYSV